MAQPDLWRRCHKRTHTAHPRRNKMRGGGAPREAVTVHRAQEKFLPVLPEQPVTSAPVTSTASVDPWVHVVGG